MSISRKMQVFEFFPLAVWSSHRQASKIPLFSVLYSSIFYIAKYLILHGEKLLRLVPQILIRNTISDTFSIFARKRPNAPKTPRKRPDNVLGAFSSQENASKTPHGRIDALMVSLVPPSSIRSLAPWRFEIFFPMSLVMLYKLYGGLCHTILK